MIDRLLKVNSTVMVSLYLYMHDTSACWTAVHCHQH